MIDSELCDEKASAKISAELQTAGSCRMEQCEVCYVSCCLFQCGYDDYAWLARLSFTDRI